MQISFWPKESLISKVLDALDLMVSEDFCAPAQCSKLRGQLQWLARSCCGRVSRGFAGPLLHREFLDTEPYALNVQLRTAFAFVRLVLESRPQRCFPLCPAARKPLLCASDGQDSEQRLEPA